MMGPYLLGSKHGLGGGSCARRILHLRVLPSPVASAWASETVMVGVGNAGQGVAQVCLVECDKDGLQDGIASISVAASVSSYRHMTGWSEPGFWHAKACISHLEMTGVTAREP